MKFRYGAPRNKSSSIFSDFTFTEFNKIQNSHRRINLDKKDNTFLNIKFAENCEKAALLEFFLFEVFFVRHLHMKFS